MPISELPDCSAVAKGQGRVVTGSCYGTIIAKIDNKYYSLVVAFIIYEIEITKFPSKFDRYDTLFLTFLWSE